jgi:hypothetical protein
MVGELVRDLATPAISMHNSRSSEHAQMLRYQRLAHTKFVHQLMDALRVLVHGVNNG